ARGRAVRREAPVAGRPRSGAGAARRARGGGRARARRGRGGGGARQHHCAGRRADARSRGPPGHRRRRRRCRRAGRGNRAPRGEGERATRAAVPRAPGAGGRLYLIRPAVGRAVRAVLSESSQMSNMVGAMSRRSSNRCAPCFGGRFARAVVLLCLPVLATLIPGHEGGASGAPRASAETKIVFVSTRGGEPDLYALDPASAANTRLTENEDVSDDVQVSRDG